MRGCSSPFGARAANFTPVQITHLSGGPPLPRNAFAVWPCCGSSSAASSAEVCALLFPPFRSASGADIAACAVCVMLPAGAATLARFLEGSHRNVLGRVSANTGRSGKVVGVGDAFDERGQGEGVGEEGSLGALFGCVRAKRARRLRTFWRLCSAWRAERIRGASRL